MKFASAIMTEASGSLRGIVASNNRGGAYFRGKVIPKNPLSPPQMSRRNRYGSVGARWSNVLSDAQRQGWEDLADHGVLGGDINSGLQAYQRVNSYAGIVFPSTFRDNAPTKFTQIFFLSGSLTSVNAATRDVIFNFVAGAGWATGTSRCLVFLSRPRNAWVRPRKSFQFVGTTIGSAGPSVTLPGAYPFHCSVGQVVDGYMVGLGPANDSRCTTKYQLVAGVI